jgi:hypothetical protein
MKEKICEWEAWARKKINQRCTVEAQRCIPLRNDPICRVCFESDREEGEHKE